MAIANSNADYIIQIDGDCILDKFFIKDHLNSIRKNTYLFSSRVNINASYLDKIFYKKTKFNYFSRGLSKRNRLIRIPLLGKLLYRPKLMTFKKLRGCNLSYLTSDLIAVGQGIMKIWLVGEERILKLFIE